jgi:multiple antibiotic resistance protein
MCFPKTGSQRARSDADGPNSLAVPYLLNPADIAALVIASSNIDSVIIAVIIIVIVLLVGAIDFAIFGKMDKLTKGG